MKKQFSKFHYEYKTKECDSYEEKAGCQTNKEYKECCCNSPSSVINSLVKSLKEVEKKEKQQGLGVFFRPCFAVYPSPKLASPVFGPSRAMEGLSLPLGALTLSAAVIVS